MIKNPIPKNKSVPALCAVVFCLMTLPACKKEQPPAPPAVPPPVKQSPPPGKPVQERNSSATASAAHAVSSQFDFSKKKDPFKPFVAVKAAPVRDAEAIRKIARDSLPIHSYDVSQFKLIGIIVGSGASQAMVTDPQGKGYVLKVGMSIGKNDGKITAITPTTVNVLEQFKDDNGRVLKENIKLTLPRKQ